jgi:hypothetical protein
VSGRLAQTERAAAQVWRLVSGYPPGKRENRVMVVLVDPQRIVDASGNEPNSPFFVLGGFVAPAVKWAAFSEAWQAVLDIPPKLEYFRMTEAANMSGQFHRRFGWTEAMRNDRVISFARIARKFASIRVSAWIRRADFDTHILSLPALVRSLGVDNPYVMLVNQIVLAVATFGSQHGVNTPCDYIFDSEEGFDEEVFANWPNVKRLLELTGRSDVSQFVGERPIFRDDKSFLPLQAADLYAWQVRKCIAENNQVSNQTIRIPANRTLRVFGGLPSINREYPTEEVLRLREFLIERGKDFVASNPGIQLVDPITDPRQRRKAHSRARKARNASAKPSDPSLKGRSS